MQTSSANRFASFTTMPTKTKWMVIACAVYLLSPIDFLPDVIPLLGQCDDLVAFITALVNVSNAAQVGNRGGN